MTIHEYIVSSGICTEDELLDLIEVSPSGYDVLRNWICQLMDINRITITDSAECDYCLPQHNYTCERHSTMFLAVRE